MLEPESNQEQKRQSERTEIGHFAKSYGGVASLANGGYATNLPQNIVVIPVQIMCQYRKGYLGTFGYSELSVEFR